MDFNTTCHSKPKGRGASITIQTEASVGYVSWKHTSTWTGGAGDRTADLLISKFALPLRHSRRQGIQHFTYGLLLACCFIEHDRPGLMVGMMIDANLKPRYE